MNKEEHKAIEYLQAYIKNDKEDIKILNNTIDEDIDYYTEVEPIQKRVKYLETIKNLIEKLQKEYILQDKFKINGKTQRKISYKADFTYFSLEDNKLHVVDVKGFKTEIYKLKKKMFEYKYGIEIEEV